LHQINIVKAEKFRNIQ